MTRVSTYIILKCINTDRSWLIECIGHDLFFNMKLSPVIWSAEEGLYNYYLKSRFCKNIEICEVTEWLEKLNVRKYSENLPNSALL